MLNLQKICVIQDKSICLASDHVELLNIQQQLTSYLQTLAQELDLDTGNSLKEVYIQNKELISQDLEFIDEMMVLTLYSRHPMQVWRFINEVYNDHRSSLTTKNMKFSKKLVTNTLNSSTGGATYDEITRIVLEDIITQLINNPTSFDMEDTLLFFKAAKYLRLRELSQKIYELYGNDLITSSAGGPERSNALIYLEGSDNTNAFLYVRKGFDNYINEISNGKNANAKLLNIYPYNDMEYVYNESAKLISTSEKSTVFITAHGIIKYGIYDDAYHHINIINNDNIYTKEVVETILKRVGDKPIDIILQSCSGGLAAYNIKPILPEGSQFISMADKESRPQLFPAVVDKAFSDPNNSNLTLDYLLKLGICTEQAPDSKDSNLPIRMVTVWNQIVELQAASKYMIQNYEAIFTPDIVQALHERFKGVESTCGVDVTHGNISSILEKMSSNSIQHQDLYGMISITEEVIEIYHNNHDNLLDVLYS